MQLRGLWVQLLSQRRDAAMMVVTTMFLALVVLVPIYVFIVRRIGSPHLAYLIVTAIGVLCILGGTVHFIYVGIEIMAFGSLLVWAHHRWWLPRPSSPVAR